MKKPLIVIAAVAFLQLGYIGVWMLRHGDPLASLNDAVLSPEYSSAFWASERRSNTDLWARALERCSDAGNAESRPNCAVVALVQAKGSGNQTANGRSSQSVPSSSSDDIGNGLTGHGARQVPSGFRHRDVPAGADSAAR